MGNVFPRLQVMILSLRFSITRVTIYSRGRKLMSEFNLFLQIPSTSRTYLKCLLLSLVMPQGSSSLLHHIYAFLYRSGWWQMMIAEIVRITWGSKRVTIKHIGQLIYMYMYVRNCMEWCVSICIQYTLW